MKKRMIAFAGVLILSLTMGLAAPVWAGEGILEKALESLLEEGEKADEAMEEYVFGLNAGSMDQGDAQIFSKNVAYMDDLEKDEIKVLAEFTQVNYTIEDGEMKMCSGSSVPMLLTLIKNEDGSYTVKDGKQAEDGEGFADSVKAMCEEVGITFDEYQTYTKFGETNDVDALIKYMDEHPEITGAEYMGEIKTADELRKITK